MKYTFRFPALKSVPAKQGKAQSQILSSMDTDAALLASFRQTKAKHSVYEMFERFTELSLVVDE